MSVQAVAAPEEEPSDTSLGWPIAIIATLGMSVSYIDRATLGAIAPMVRSALDITPVRITCTQQMLGKNDKWWRVPRRAGHFLIDVGDDIAVDCHLAQAGAQALAARRLNDELARHLAAESPHAAA